MGLCPGAVKTNFHSQANIRSQGLSAEEVAQMTFRQLGKKPSFIIGVSNKVIAFFLLLLPVKIRLQMEAKAIQQMR